MLINQGNLTGLYTGFKTAFQSAFAGVQPSYLRVATPIPSTTLSEEYGWLGEMPTIREWLGDRVIQGLGQYKYTIRNRDWELTIGVNRNAIEDDTYGIYSPLIADLGRRAASFPDKLVWPLVKSGFTALCYDGKAFFAADHPVVDSAGVTQAVSNTGGGAGTPWYLFDTTQAIKPVIFQNRKSFDFVRMDGPTDEVVFNRREYRYGIDGRANVGFSFWQLGYGSKQTLDAAAFAAARAAMMSLKGAQHDEPLGITPNLLVVPPALEAAAREVLMAERDAAGATNVWRGTAELLVVPWLA